MEKAVLRTLIYADIFDYPMKVWEIRKWLLGRRASLQQVEKALKKGQGSRVKSGGGYYFLKGRQRLVNERIGRQKISERFLREVRWVVLVFKIIPWVKLVGVSGSLAMENADKKSDIDLFIITEKNRLWICRLGLLGILELFGKRRKRGENEKQAAGKICINLLLEEDNLAQSNKNIYLAHEVLQMRVLWERERIYSQFLLANEWVFKYLPNWTTSANIGSSPLRSNKKILSLSLQNDVYVRARYELRSTSRAAFIDKLEKLLKWFQLRYMGKPGGMEQIKEGALYFHPEDIGPKVLKEYKRKMQQIKS